MSAVRVIGGTAAGFLMAVILHFIFSLIMGNILWIDNIIWGQARSVGVQPPQQFMSWKDETMALIFAGWKFYLLGATIGLLASLIIGAMRRRPEEYPL